MGKPIRKLSPTILRSHKGISFVGITTCFFVHDGKGNFFMAKRSRKARDEHGKWELGGGGLKWGNTVLDNTLREAEEEYGVRAIKPEFLGYRDIFRTLSDGTQTHWVGFDFALEVDPKTITIKEPDMFDDSGWFQLDNLPDPLHSQHLIFQEKYQKQLRKILKNNSHSVYRTKRRLSKFLFS